MNQEIVFLLAGLLGGLVAVAVGVSRPTVLAVGVGLLFFIALLAAIAMTNSWSRVSPGIWRYAVAAIISIAAYLLALITFWGLFGYSPDLFGVHASKDMADFGADIWIGLLAACLVASICIEFVAYVLTSRWSNGVLASFAGAGVLSIVASFTATKLARFAVSTMPTLYAWVFLGVLLAVGEALFCGLLGAQILRNSRPLGRVTDASALHHETY
jgi:hypothetical protein